MSDQPSDRARANEAPVDTATPSELHPVVRFIGSHVTRVLLSPTRKRITDGVREGIRRVTGAPHRVHYFHEVADPYSHLAAQAIRELLTRYDIELIPHATASTRGANVPEPVLLAELAARDARAIAPHYGLTFPAGSGGVPSAAAVKTAERILSRAAREDDPARFADRAVQVGEALFAGDDPALQQLAESLPVDDAARSARDLAAGHDLRERMGHYSGAMLQYAGEWFWGVDRLVHLETRLTRLGAARGADGLRFPRPPIPRSAVERAGEMTLEFFPSLRSPYTAIGFEPTLDLAHGTGVRLITRPVLPMVMRGVPVPLGKAQYIASDTLREAGLLGVPFGRIYDPVGDPVRRGFAIWHWAREQGRGDAFMAAFLRAAFADGVNTTNDAGRRRVAESVGLDWSQARSHLDDTAWEDELERNRLTLVNEMGLWGVPSYRLRGPQGEPDLCVWGQDRLWLVASEIQRRGRHDAPRSS